MIIDTFLGGGAAWFTIPAVLGTLYFFLQLLLMGAAEVDLDLDVDVDTDVGGDTGGEFRALSLQTISAFFMGGGWMGLTAFRLLGFDLFISALIALISGFVVGWVLVKLIRAALTLRSSGNIALSDAIGLTGTVSITVPPAGRGTGRARLVVGERQRELNAAQLGQAEIPTGMQVKVVRIDEPNNAVVIEPTS